MRLSREENVDKLPVGDLRPTGNLMVAPTVKVPMFNAVPKLSPEAFRRECERQGGEQRETCLPAQKLPSGFDPRNVELPSPAPSTALQDLHRSLVRARGAEGANTLGYAERNQSKVLYSTSELTAC